MYREKEYSNNNESVSSVPGQVVIYGTSWCAKTQMVKRFFERMHIPYKFMDIEGNPGTVSELRWITGGYANHPTVVINGQAFIEPTINELEMVMEKYSNK
jgi:mycoredoxin